jgi:hypothetical protein
MTVAIPEAAQAVSGGTAAVRGAAARGRTIRAPSSSYESRTQAPRRPRQRASSGRVSPSVNLPSGGRRAARTASRARLPGGRNYQPVILAEFLVAVLVVALAPIAKGGTDTAKAKGGPSPYDTNSLKQLLMIGLVYFILALLSSGKSLGRVSAWFGGLVLVAIGVQQTVNGGFAGVLRMFGFNVGGGLGTVPAAPDGTSLLPGLNLNVGQFSPGALAQGVQAGPPPTVKPVPDATGIFPTIEPGGKIVQSSVTPPPGGTGTVTTA